MDSPPAPPPLSFHGSDTTIRREGSSVHTVLADARIVWGDLVITGKSGELDETDGVLKKLTVRGDVTLTRGPDSLRCESLTFDGTTLAFSATDAQIIGPPFVAI